MKKTCFILILSLFLPFTAQAVNLGSSLSGKILLSVEENGEAWYVYPQNKKRYYLGRPDDAFHVMRELGLGISQMNFQKIAQAGMPIDGDLELAKSLAGQIVLQVEKNGEAWYINPDDLKKYYLGRPKDAFRVMRELGLGISRENLARVHKTGMDESIDRFSSYEHKKITTKKNETYSIDVVEIDLANPNLKIITDTADLKDCDSNCSARTLADFVFENNAFAGINGTYFESYNSAKRNYYYYPVYNSEEGVLINEDQLKYWTTGPIMAFDKNNKFYYFKDSREFKSLEYFEETYDTKLQAAIGNRPRLIEKGMNLLIEWDIDDKQRNLKAARNALAYKDDKLYLVVAWNTTVPDLADIMQAMEVEYALNLDGGYSTALFYNDEYMVGPGRDVPNVLLFGER